MKEELLQTLEIYKVPSQSMWRACELKKLRELSFSRPILEIGCADGAFSSLIFDEIDDAIDLNQRAVDRYLRKHGSSGIYKQIHCMDARQMKFGQSSFKTVFANCVIEHIPDLSGVLESCCRVLEPGGKFVTTVPLKRMNDHLLLRSPWYTRMRQRSLSHVNLLTEQEWEDVFLSAGFTSVETIPYLSGRNCHLWDFLDAPIGIGFGRCRISVILRVAEWMLPPGVNRRLHEKEASWLASMIDTSIYNNLCAILLIAHK